MSDIAIRVENLSKQYRIGTKQESYKTLRDTLASAAQVPVRALRSLSGHQKHDKTQSFWALKDVSFEVKRGEVVGIIGRNGAGKSTLLKILSRITEPTSGYADIHGRVASLLEVGTGFHPELTGRENIFLNGAILGMKREEIRRKFDEIVAFAEVEQFVDTPVKHYSSGMYLRLAFAVAAHLEPEILVVDEVLAVGDAAFQKKCLGKMGEVAKEGRTVLFVSHNMSAVRNLCSRAILMDAGCAICNSNVDRCLQTYLSKNEQERTSHWECMIESASSPLYINRAAVQLQGDQPRLVLKVVVELITRSPHKPAFIAVDILDQTGNVIMQSLPTIEGFMPDDRLNHVVNLSIELPPLVPNRYSLTIWVGSHNTETYNEIKECVVFDIHQSPTKNRNFVHTPDHGWIVPNTWMEYTW